MKMRQEILVLAVCAMCGCATPQPGTNGYTMSQTRLASGVCRVSVWHQEWDGNKLVAEALSDGGTISTIMPTWVQRGCVVHFKPRFQSTFGWGIWTPVAFVVVGEKLTGFTLSAEGASLECASWREIAEKIKKANKLLQEGDYPDLSILLVFDLPIAESRFREAVERATAMSLHVGIIDRLAVNDKLQEAWCQLQAPKTSANHAQEAIGAEDAPQPQRRRSANRKCSLEKEGTCQTMLLSRPRAHYSESSR